MEKNMSRSSLLNKAVALSLAAATLTTGSLAAAQDSNPPPPPQTPPDGHYNVPPPPGYQPGADERSPQAREEDDRYSYEAERWAAANCVAQRANNTASGAIIGGLLGAVVGAGLGGRYDRGGAALAGGALGAVAGGAIGGSQANNPNCPPGYVLRPGAPAFYPAPVYGGVVYAAPGWYDPWVWYGGHWIYRPYPYHRYWYRTHPR
jgi:hypothetical protein